MTKYVFLVIVAALPFGAVQVKTLSSDNAIRDNFTEGFDNCFVDIEVTLYDDALFQKVLFSVLTATAMSV